MASLSMTGRCNLRCIHCSYYSPHLDRPALHPFRKAQLKGDKLPDKKSLKQLLNIDLDSDRLRSLVDELIKMGTRRYQFSGNGEPFLNKHMIETISRLKHANCYCLANTNGTLLDREISNELIKVKFDDLRVTTMAGTQDLYRKTHPGSPAQMFNKLFENLLYLSEQKSKLKVTSPKITLVFIIISQNVSGILDFAKFAVATGADRVWYRPFQVVGDIRHSKLVLNKEQVSVATKQLAEAKYYLESNNIEHNIINFYYVFSGQLDTSRFYKTVNCYYGWLASHIEPDGTVYPCCGCHDPLGNIYETNFYNVWNGEAYNNFRKMAAHINKNETFVDGCNCERCVHHTANLRVFKLLHPLKGQTGKLMNLLSEQVS